VEAQTQMKFNLLAGGLLALLVVAFLLFRNNRQKRKANRLLQQQKEEIDANAKELAKQKTDVEQLEEIGKKITSSLSVEDIIGTVYNNVNSLMDAKVFGIGIYNEILKTIEFPATYENGRVLPSYSNGIEERNRLSVSCFNEGKEIVMGNLDEQHKEYVQNIPTPVAGDQAVSLIYLPLMAKGKKLGVITVQSFQQNAYSDYHLYMLRNIAIYAAIALENAASYTQLNQSMLHLKETQKQLIQSEKMASLGELTAGIAHEIQNPLNFVNNFSDVNQELIDEMQLEMDRGNFNDAKEIANDIKENERKINHHGRRADAIVKGMLQHSRKSTGQKEPTDINVLADEYLRLSYHGLRAKDKSFNATMKTDFDESIGKVNLISQDMGRVLLNLFNNAFYAVTEKKKRLLNGYEPTLFVSTKKLDGKVQICVKDNGNGIPQKALDKIFQPFFTTKPTGEGTGLGLSLSYDIVKVHEGTLKVKTKEGEFTEFLISLPA
jgi:signal transduction histidine kinase